LTICLAAILAAAPTRADDFPAVPLPPAIDRLVGLPTGFAEGRAAYVAILAREAERHGLPPALADAVAFVESGYRPGVVGGVGEVGLMQIRPQTAAMLGHDGGVTALFDPETNIRFGVRYLARAWELAGGDVCRALMKYRAGWGEERMSPLSVEYCRRARAHLASVGSPLAGDALAPAVVEAAVGRVRIASAGDGEIAIAAPKARRSGAEVAWTSALQRARAQARSAAGPRTSEDSRRFWAAQEARIRAMTVRSSKARRLSDGVAGVRQAI